MKPIPYCPPGALTALVKMNERNEPPAAMTVMWYTLKARGWMDRNSQITKAGRDYVNLRISKL